MGASSRPFSRSIVFLCLASLLAARAVVAQPEDDPRKTARLRLGPVYLTPSLTLRDFGVDTNVFNQAGQAKQDFTFTIGPKVDAWLPIARRALVRASTVVDFVYFHTFGSERSVNPSVAVRPEIYFNRLTVFAEGSHLNTRERPSFEIDARSRRTEGAVKAGVDVRLFRKVAVELAGSQSAIRFDADAVFLGTYLSEVLNRDVRAASLALRYRYSPLATFVVQGEAATERFLESPERDSDSARMVVGVELRPRALISGSAYLGVRRFFGLHPELPDFRGFAASVGLGYTLRGMTQFGFTADRDVSYSFDRLQPYYIRQGAGVSVRQALGRRFDVMVGVQRHAYRYRRLLSVTVPQGDGPQVDVTRNLSASVGFLPNRDMRIGIGAAYWDRASNVQALRDYRGLRAGLSVAYGF